MDPIKNNYLIFAPNVVRTPETDIVIAALDSKFRAANRKALVSSIKRFPQEQLDMIRSFLKERGLDHIYQVGMTCKLNDVIVWGGKKVFGWQPAWSKLLNIGILINPPISAEVLMPYFKDGKNKQGEIIEASYHFTGKAFDISGRWVTKDNQEQNILDDVVDIIASAAKDSSIGIQDFVREDENNCGHVDVF